MIEQSRKVPAVTWAALALVAIGALLAFLVPGVGWALLLVAPVLAIIGFVQSHRPVTAVIVALALLPLALMAWAIYELGTYVS